MMLILLAFTPPIFAQGQTSLGEAQLNDAVQSGNNNFLCRLPLTPGTGWVKENLSSSVSNGGDHQPSFATLSAHKSLAEKSSSPSYGIGHPSFLSPHSKPIAISGGYVFVANTPADTVDVIDAETLSIVRRISVGIDPVCIAVRPDGREVWVANHISDSVSVIDSDPESPTYFQIVATIQDLDPLSKATRFDEPVGIAFANSDKAYVALSSENKIAVINVATRRVDKTLAITAQDPRAIAVRGNRLYVLPFESNNQTQISGCAGPPDGDLCTFTIQNFNNVLSSGLVVDIVKNPRVPDRDLYIFDTTTDALIEIVNTVGTLLYGLAVDSQGRVFVAQTDARNDINGKGRHSRRRIGRDGKSSLFEPDHPY